jgi:hypothetical protein
MASRPMVSGGSHQTMFVSATISGEIDNWPGNTCASRSRKLIAPGADDKPTVEKCRAILFFGAAVG